MKYDGDIDWLRRPRGQSKRADKDEVQSPMNNTCLPLPGRTESMLALRADEEMHFALFTFSIVHAHSGMPGPGVGPLRSRVSLPIVRVM